MSRSRVRLAAVGVAGVVLAGGVSGCVARETTGVAAPLPAPGAPAAVATAACRDGAPPQASIAPGPITTSPGSWPAGSRMAEIRRDGTLRVGVSGDAVLWGYSDPTDGGALAGYDVDLARAVADALGVEIEFRVLPLSGRLPALRNGQVDLVAERFSMTCDRWQGSAADPATFVNFSAQYYTAGQRVFVRVGSGVRDVQGLGGAPVCAVTGSTSLATLQSLPGLDLDIVQASDSAQCLVRFQEGEVVAISADDTTLAGFAAQDRYGEVVGGVLGEPQPYGLGTSAEHPEFTRFVNAVLERQRETGGLQRLYDRWMKDNVRTPDPGVPAATYGRDPARLGRA